jgi:transposase
MYERYQAVRLVLEGQTRPATVYIIGRSAYTVGKYVSAYENHSFSGFRRGISTGRPAQLSHLNRRCSETFPECKN